MKRSLGHMLGLTVPFKFPLFPCQKELKSDMVVNFLVAWYVILLSCLVVLVGFFLVGLALDGTLKLRHCTYLFTMRFLPWSLPRICHGGGKRQFFTPGLHSDTGGNFGKRVRLTRKTRPGVSSMINPDPGHPTPRRWKRLRPPFLRRSGR